MVFKKPVKNQSFLKPQKNRKTVAAAAMAPTRCTYSGCPGPPKHIVSAAKLKLHTPTLAPFFIQKQSSKQETNCRLAHQRASCRDSTSDLILFACVIIISLAMCTNLPTLPMLAENRITSCAEDFGQRPLTNNIVTLYLPGHCFGRCMRNSQKNDQFSPLGGKWAEANFRRTLDTASASDRISGERSATAPDAEDFGQRPLTNNIVTLYLPGHCFGRCMRNSQKNDQFSPLGGKWTEANFRRTLDTASASDCPLLPMPLFLTQPARPTSQSHHAGAA